MITWPSSLVREIAARRCVLFLGAGVSASATSSPGGEHPKTWGEFLGEATALVTDAAKKRVISKLIREKKYLLALQAIRDEANTADYRDLLNRSFNNPAFQRSELHECILDLDSRLLITSNFDKIYETYCMSTEGAETGAFKVINYFSTDIVDEIRSDTRLIIKAHGSIDDISKMIFTRAEYHRAKSIYPRFYDILKAIFLTHTAVFIGCSMDDPDVLLLLEDVKITASAERPHYVLIRRRSQDVFSMSDWKTTYNIWPLEYGPSHSDLVTDLRVLQDRVETERAVTVT
jgi:hypothetical protein